MHRRGHRGGSSRGGTGGSDPRRWPCRKLSGCCGPTQGPRWDFSFSSRKRLRGGGRNCYDGKSDIFPRNVKIGEQHFSLLCPLMTRWTEKRYPGRWGRQGCRWGPRGLLCWLGLRGVFNPPIAIILSGSGTWGQTVTAGKISAGSAKPLVSPPPNGEGGHYRA